MEGNSLQGKCMKFFSVPTDQQAMIERLVNLHRMPLKQRKGLIKALETDGYTVSFLQGTYYVHTSVVTYQTPKRRCPHCKKVQLLVAFLTIRDVEHPWCQTCRHTHPVEAERARAERDYYAKKGRYDIKANEQCANTTCPNDRIIPPDKLRKGATFCSRACYKASI